MSLTNPLIDDELVGFLRAGASLMLSAVAPNGVADLCMGLACLVDAPSGRLRVVFDRRTAAPLLELLESSGSDRVALVASRPTDLRTVQIKGGSAQVQALPAAEHEEVQRATQALRLQFAQIGLGDPYAATLLDYLPAELVCVGFVPLAVFEQTPGPKAGQRLGPRA
jgi:hypothetical protein